MIDRVCMNFIMQEFRGLILFDYYFVVIDYLCVYEFEVWCWVVVWISYVEQCEFLCMVLLCNIYCIDLVVYLEIYVILELVWQCLGLNVEVLVILYQLVGLEMNVLLVFVFGEVYLIVQGDLLVCLFEQELLVVFGYEFVYYVFWLQEEGVFLQVECIFFDVCLVLGVVVFFSEIWCCYVLYIELFVDCGVVIGCGLLDLVIFLLVKFNIGICQVDVVVYLWQVVEVDVQQIGVSEVVSYLEVFMCVCVLQLWWEGSEEFGLWLQQCLQGLLVLCVLDLFGQYWL